MRKEEIQRERERAGRAGERAPESDERRKERGNESDREKIERSIDAGNSKIYELPLHIIQTCKSVAILLRTVDSGGWLITYYAPCGRDAAYLTRHKGRRRAQHGAC